MAYSFFALSESFLTISGGVTLDGLTQGTGEQLDGETITIDPTVTPQSFDEIALRDNTGDTTFDDNDSGQVLDGDQTFNGTLYLDGTVVEAEYRIVLEDPDTGERFVALAVNVRDSNPSYATVEGLAFVDALPPVGKALTVVETTEGPGDFSVAPIDEDRIVPICFVTGTSVATPLGPRQVDALRPGDAVTRADGSVALLRRVYRRALTPTEIADEPRLRPVRIAAGALGHGLPECDLLVSRQHRLQVSSRIVERMFGQRDCLVAAIRLTGLPGIAEVDCPDGVEYVHLLFDRHEVILAEGAPSETLLIGPTALGAMDDAARAEVLTLFPDAADATVRLRPALMIPTPRAQKALIRRHARHAKPVLERWTPPAVAPSLAEPPAQKADPCPAVSP